jgi:phage FluMu protein Com
MGNLRVRCTKCETPFRAPAAAAGKRVKCPHCQTPNLVPAEQEEEATAPVKKPLRQPEPRAERPRPQPQPQPARRPRRSADNQALIGLIVKLVVLGAVVVGGFIVYNKYIKPLLNREQEEHPSTPTAPPTGTPPTQPVTGGNLTWTADASQAAKLGEDTIIKGYHYHPPKSFKSQKATPEVGAAHYWSGASSSGDSDTSLYVTVVPCEESEEPEKAIDQYFRDTFKQDPKILEKKVEHGLVGSEPFIRVSWSGETAENKPLRGVTYLVYHSTAKGADLCGLSVYEQADKKTSDLNVAEAAIRSFAKK